MEVKVCRLFGQGKKPWQALLSVIGEAPFQSGSHQRRLSFTCSCLSSDEVVISATSRELREELIRQVACAVLYEDSAVAFADRQVYIPTNLPLPLKIKRLSKFKAAPALEGEVRYRKRKG